MHRTLVPTEASSPSISSSDPTFSGSSFNGASFRQDYENTGSITGTYWDIGATQRLVTGVPTILGATIAPTNQRFAPSATQTIQVAFIGGVWVDVLLVEDGTRLLQEDGTSALLLDAVVGTGVVFAPSVSTAGLAQSVTTLAIGPASQRFIPTVVPGPVAITTVAIGTATQLFIPTVAPGPVAVAGATRATTLAVNVPTVAVGAVTITTGTFAPTVLAFAPTVVPQAVTITGSTLAPTAQLFTALVSTGAIAILGVTVSSTLALFAPVLTGLTSGSTIVSGSGTFAPTVVQTVLVAHRPTSVVLNLPTVVLPAVQAVTLATLGSGVVLQVPTVAAGPIAFTAATIAPTAILQTVTVAPGPVAVTGVTLAAASQTFLPTLTQGAVAVGTPALPSTALLFVPTVVQQVLAATRASASVLFIPTVIGDRAVTTLVIGTTTQLFAPTALPSGALGGQTVPSTLVLNSPTVTVGPVAVLGTTVPTTLSVNLPSVATLTLVTGGTRLSFLQVFAPPTVTAGAVAITGQTVSSAGQVFTPNLTVGGTPVSSAFIGSTAALYAQQLIARLDGTFIASGAVLFPATVLAHQAVTGTTIPTGNARFVPSVAAGIGGATRPTTVVLTTPTVAVGPVTVLAPTLTAQAVAFAPSLGVGATSVTTGARPSTGQLFAPTVGMRVDLPFLGSADQAFALVVVAEPKVVTPLWVKTTTLFPPITLPLGELLAGTVASGSRIFPPRFVAYAPPGEVHEFVATLVRAVGVGTEVCRLVDEPVILTRTAAVTVTLDRTHETSGPVVRRDFVMDVER